MTPQLASEAGCRVNQVTGLFRFKMKVRDEERPAIVEITGPGIKSEDVVRIVRQEWANLVVPGVSQNRIECLGWERIEARSEGLQPAKAIGPNPLIFWQAAGAALA